MSIRNVASLSWVSFENFKICFILFRLFPLESFWSWTFEEKCYPSLCYNFILLNQRYLHFEISGVCIMSFNKSGSISINSSLCSSESPPLAFLAVSMRVLQASALNVLKIVHINDLSGSCPSSMSGKYLISSGSSFTNFQTSFTLSSLYFGIGSSVFWLCFIAYYRGQLYIVGRLTSFRFANNSFKKNVGHFQTVVNIAQLKIK